MARPSQSQGRQKQTPGSAAIAACIAFAIHSKDMKTSTLPPLRVEPRLRSQAERLLRAGETLSSFIVDAVEERVRNRAMEDEFIKRGLVSAERARRSGKYTPADLVVAGLRRRLDDARKAGSRRPGRKARRTR